MKIELVELLRCPVSGQRLKADSSKNDLESGWLVSEDEKHRYPIHNGIPRFVPESNYADNFGMQWNKFRQTQLDSYSGHPISSERFWKATGWTSADITGKWVLDIGCGAGRFAEIALTAGAHVVALDYSGAVDACYANLKHFTNLYVVQGDIYSLPFADDVFPFVYSLGVLQHTPNVAKAFAALPPKVSAKGGKLCTDFYWKRFRTICHAKYLFRPITKRMPPKTLFHILSKITPVMLKTSQILGRIPAAGKYIKRIVPVADYTGVFPLDKRQLQEWALMDTFDMLAPKYDKPQNVDTIRSWMENSGFKEVDVFQANHLVVRGTKP